MPVFIATAEEVAEGLRSLQQQIEKLGERVSDLEDQVGGEPPVDPPAMTGSLQAVVTISGRDYVFDEVEAVDLGDYIDPDGRFVMECRRAKHRDLPDYSADFRRIPGGNGDWACVVLDYGNGLGTPTNLPAHTVTIVTQLAEGADVHEVIDVPAHWYNARWRWQSGEWPHMRSVEQLVARGWLPRLDPAVNKGTAGHLGVPSYEPMGLAGLSAEMPQTGGRADIGFVTDWQGEFLCTDSSEMLSGVLAQGEAGATIPFHFRDPATDALLDLFNDYRYASCYWTGNDSVNPYIQQAQGTGITIDVAHMPACAWVPFCLTGDPYFLEIQHAMANYAFLDTPRSYEWVWQMPGSGQTRAMAWNLRTISQALAGTPDEVPGWLLPKSVFQQMLDQCVKGLDCIMHEGGTNRTVLHCIDVGMPGFDTWTEFGQYPANCYSHPWQSSFFAQAAAFGAVLHEELKPVAAYIAHNLIARTEGLFWDASYPAEYCLLLRPSYEAPWFTSWAECWAANAPPLGVPVSPLKNQLSVVGDYHGGVYAGLSALAHARAAGVAEISADIDPVLERYAGQMGALLGQGSNYLTWNNSYAR